MIMEQQIFYKVINGYHSSISMKNSKYSVDYKIGEWVYPKISGSDLMVFDTLKNARNIFKSYGFIYECEVQNPKINGIFIDCFWIINNDSDCTDILIKRFEGILEYKNNQQEYLEHSDYIHAPKGTIFCDAVKLIRLVK